MKSKENYYETSVCYFSKPGPSNTQLVLECVNKRAKELGVKEVIVASVTGASALKAREILAPDIHLITVTHVAGFEKPDHQELSPEIREKLLSSRINVLTAQHAFGGVGRSIRKQLGTYQVDEIMAYTLRIFGHGTKVAIELALMAADAGLVRTDHDVISIGGTGTGLDTALVLQPSNSADFLRLKVREIICKPSKF
ncbi:MAG: pyruvate kinase alpha/beta domain-containing protein [Desulfomonilaceae bacterium]